MGTNAGQPAKAAKLEQGQTHNYQDPQTKLFVKIDSRELPAADLQTNLGGNITVFEPFGGMASGMEMVLRNGLRVTRSTY